MLRLGRDFQWPRDCGLLETPCPSLDSGLQQRLREEGVLREEEGVREEGVRKEGGKGVETAARLCGRKIPRQQVRMSMSMFTTPCVSRVTSHMSHVMCIFLKCLLLLFFFLHFGGAC